MKIKSFAHIAVILLTIILIVEILDYTSIFNKEKNEKESKIISLQSQIDNANSKDTIILSNNTYFEKIIIDKELTLKGNKNKTIIDGNSNGTIIEIISNNVKLINLTIKNSGGHKKDSAINIKSDGNEIKNCIVYKNRYGIKLENSKDNQIKNCFIHNNGQGIFSTSSGENIIDNSQFRNNGFGIFLKNSFEDEIKNSYIYYNGLGIYLKNCENTNILDSAVCDNNQDGGGIWSFGSNNLNIFNSNVNHNGAGVRLENTIANISNLNLSNNMYNTFRIINVKDTKISKCNIKNSYRTAIYAQDSSFNLENSNIINSGLYGLEIKGNTNALVKNNYWNYFLGPSKTLYGKGDAILFNPFKYKAFPWKVKEIQNIGCNWNVKDHFVKKESEYEKYNINKNLDFDLDGLNNFEEDYAKIYGADPYYKDIFIEVDYTKTNDKNPNIPTDEYINQAKEIFKEYGINLHILIDDELPTFQISSAEDFLDIYWDYFLENNINNPKKGVFRYAVISDGVEELYGGFVFMGFDGLDSIGLNSIGAQSIRKNLDKGQVIIGGIIHELGHTMGLLIDDFKGIDNIGSSKPLSRDYFKYKNYKSCLNYRYVYNSIEFSDGSHRKNDFNDWENLDFSFFKNTEFKVEK